MFIYILALLLLFSCLLIFIYGKREHAKVVKKHAEWTEKLELYVKERSEAHESGRMSHSRESGLRLDFKKDNPEPKRPNQDYSNAEIQDASIPLAIIVFIAYLLFAVPYTAAAWSASVNVQNSQILVDTKIDQREVLLAEVEDKLSTSEYQLLIQAYTPEDVQWLNTRPDIEAFLSSRIDRVIALNNQVFELQNKLIQDSIYVCNRSQNPFTPRIPFMFPDCKLGQVEE